MSQYLQGVNGDTPLQAGLAFLPTTVAAFAAATATSWLIQRTSSATMSIAGCTAMLIGTAWISHVSADTSYLTGIALPMIIFGIGQGLGLSTLTTGGMAGVPRQDARRRRPGQRRAPHRRSTRPRRPRHDLPPAPAPTARSSSSPTGSPPQ